MAVRLPARARMAERVGDLGVRDVPLRRRGYILRGRYALDPAPRGRYRLEAAELVVDDPLGLAEARLTMDRVDTLLGVSPRVHAGWRVYRFGQRRRRCGAGAASSHRRLRPALDPGVPAGREPAPRALALDRQAPPADGQGADRHAARRVRRAARLRPQRQRRRTGAQQLRRPGAGGSVAAEQDGRARPALLAGAPPADAATDPDPGRRRRVGDGAGGAGGRPSRCRAAAVTRWCAMLWARRGLPRRSMRPAVRRHRIADAGPRARLLALGRLAATWPWCGSTPPASPASSGCRARPTPRVAAAGHGPASPWRGCAPTTTSQASSRRRSRRSAEQCLNALAVLAAVVLFSGWHWRQLERPQVAVGELALLAVLATAPGLLAAIGRRRWAFASIPIVVWMAVWADARLSALGYQSPHCTRCACWRPAGRRQSWFDAVTPFDGGRFALTDALVELAFFGLMAVVAWLLLDGRFAMLGGGGLRAVRHPQHGADAAGQRVARAMFLALALATRRCQRRDARPRHRAGPAGGTLSGDHGGRAGRWPPRPASPRVRCSTGATGTRWAAETTGSASATSGTGTTAR